jgi:hypothetical protein
MIRPTEILDAVNPRRFFSGAVEASTTRAIEDLLGLLPVVADDEYQFNAKAPEKGWAEGKFHWFPVGGERGNAGRIKLAGSPENPIAERTINSMEGLIELARQLELLQDLALRSQVRHEKP